jgi:hypothetical protein
VTTTSVPTAGDGAEVDDPGLTPAEQEQLLLALEAAVDGDFSVRLRLRRKGLAGDISRRSTSSSSGAWP